MPWIVRKYVIFICLLLPLAVIAQNRYRFSGKVTDKTSGEKIEMVAIQIKELNRWTISNINGDFVFNNLPEGSFTLQASCLGFEQFEAGIIINRDIIDYKLSSTTCKTNSF